jgi:hypothetical protein
MQTLSLRHCSQALRATLSVAAAFQLGCSSTFDDLSLKDEGAGKVDAGKNDAGGCSHARALAPPIISTDQTRSVEFVVAFKTYDMGEIDQREKTERYREMSYDLDNVCTGQGEGPSCVNSYWTLETPIEEGPEGRDNAQGAITYRSYRQRGSASSTEAVNSSIEAGSITTVIRIRGYNEQTVDSKVEVAVFAATMNPQNEAGELLGPLSRPQWRGEDVWAAAYPWWVDNDENNQPSTEHPKYFDANAYVTDSVLVAKLDRMEVPPFLQMSQVVITARIVRNDDGGWALTNGIFAGRVKTDDLLASVEYVREPDSPGYICRGSPSYRRSKEIYCGAADLTFEHSTDPSAQCDATSWGWTFEAQPAKLSGTGTAKQLANCTEELSPDNDSCAIHD